MPTKEVTHLIFGSNPAGIKFHLDHRFEPNNYLEAIIEITRPNTSPELYLKLLNCEANFAL